MYTMHTIKSAHFSFLLINFPHQSSSILPPYPPPMPPPTHRTPSTTRRARIHNSNTPLTSASGDVTTSVIANTDTDTPLPPTPIPPHPILVVINESTKWAVSAAVFITLALLHRNLTCNWWVLGSVLAASLCKALKSALNHARPHTARKEDPGMPSSHANSLAFLSTFASLWLFHTNTTPFLPIAIPALALFLTWLRVALGYHTIAQVAVGWGLGCGVGVGWWWGWQHSLAALAASINGLQTIIYSLTAIAALFFAISNGKQWIRELLVHLYHRRRA